MPERTASARRVIVFRRDPYHLLATGEVHDTGVNLAVCTGVVIPPRVKNLLGPFILAGGVSGNFVIPGACEVGWRVLPETGGAA